MFVFDLSGRVHYDRAMSSATHNNVASSRFAAGASQRIGSEIGRFVVTTMPVPWKIAGERIGGTPSAMLMVESMERDNVERQIVDVPECDTVLAVGGGQAVDLGKYLAWRRGLRLVTIPTVLSVDAFVTPAAAVRERGHVQYVGSATPDPLVIDYDLLRTAPAELNIAGVGDLISIHTATFDWEMAAAAGKSEYPFSAEAVGQARQIVKDVEAIADAIRAQTDAGLRAIVDGYLRVNELCLPVDHYRVEEGSEHYTFYELEARLGRGFIHGYIVGLGVYLMSRLQRNRAEWITSLMDRLGLKYQPVDMQLTRDDVATCLKNVKAFTEESQLWYTVIQERPISDAWIDATLVDLEFA